MASTLSVRLVSLEKEVFHGDAAGMVVPAIEVSSTLDERELHILGYFVAPGSPEILAHEDRAVRLREKRMLGMIQRLAEADVRVQFEAVVEAAGPIWLVPWWRPVT